VIRLTRQTDYGIVLLSLMAAEGIERLTAAELSERSGLPSPMVSKILKVLARERLLDSQRGVNGGYSLARGADEITLAEIVTALEGPIAITDCIEDGPAECSYEDFCQVRPHWQLINETLRQALSGVTLAEMSDPRLTARRLPTTARQLVTLGVDR
jgi:FeS assembly SUF system regulator